MMLLNRIFYLALTMALIACGGGGGGSSSPSGPVTSTNTFNLRAAQANLAINGFTKTFTISGSCSGTYSTTSAPATTSTTFEGQTAFSSIGTNNVTFSNCTPASDISSGTTYYDSNHAYLGQVITGDSYEVWASTPALPTAAKVGDTGVMGTVNKYTNNSKATSLGTDNVTYVIEADTAATAVFNVITKSYDTSNIHTLTQENRWRINSDGSISLISIDYLETNGSTIHLIMN